MGSFSLTRPTRLYVYLKEYCNSNKKKDRKYWSKAIEKQLKNE